MWYLNKDVLFMIFEELSHNDKKSLHSCLLVNRTWCTTAMPILWRDPSQFFMTENSMNMLFNVIFLHLSEESKNNLKDQGINNSFIEKYQRPLFNYINFWKYLDLDFLEEIILSKNIKNSNMSIVKNEMLRLFINRNTKFLHLYIRGDFDYQLHLIPGAEYCFSELESFHCCAEVDQNILEGLARICKLIKKFRFDNVHYCTDGTGIFKLIEVQKKLNNVSFIGHFNNLYDLIVSDESFYKSLEESLIKHTDTVQYLKMSWTPITRILSCFVNLISLNIDSNFSNKLYWNNFENVKFSFLKILKVRRVPSNFLVNLIKSTIGTLSEICMNYDGIDSKRLFQTIYQNCPNLRYLDLSLVDNINLFIPELESLLINCQLLDGLIIDVQDTFDTFNWNELFIILIRSSSINLFKFKFYSIWMIKLEEIDLFLDNWENKNPILLEISYLICNEEEKLNNLLKEYEIKGIIKKYLIDDGFTSRNFEWV
ncbi:hypothetical protein RclHR1_07600009 [Rhizophagus clarus]|uniref:F-box domain-containing protein n=1 Tax=Rhizophagus clarus TaxID=94130 RepID=A0A2Z6SCR5_9GLOM|nr:hypothetical protein RclHR1_07600009 [Rhizophagus clarus]GET04532.1 hypothetical protein GLOIN_2v1884183 [Rhizophagus clarus]